MGWTATPQILGLVRGEPKAGQKHRANGKAIVGEIGNERITTSATFDETRSYLNKYEYREGLSSSGFQCWDYMEDRANSYTTHIKMKNGREVDRRLKSDAVVGYAIIFNPPEEVCVDWTDEQYSKFFEDSWEFMKQKEPRLFRDENIVLDAIHYDEGVDKAGRSKHKHIAGEARDKDGRYCGTLIDAKMLAEINKEYPKFMREHGWDMDDLDCTDWDKYKTDENYKAERKAKWKKSGNSVNKYLKQKSADTAKEEAADLEKIADYVEQATEMAQNAQTRLEGVIERENAVFLKEQALKAKEQAMQEREDAVKLREDKADARKKEQDIRGVEQDARDVTQNARESDLNAKAEKITLDQKKLLKDKLSMKKWQEKKEAEFQVKEDALDAQKRAEDAREAENSKAIEYWQEHCKKRADTHTTTAYDNSLQESTGYNRPLPKLPGE